MIRRQCKFVIGTASLIAAASVVVPGIAGATTPSTKAPTPDFAYFAGKTITIIEPSAPVAITNATGVAVGQFLDTYLHATVNVQYVPVNGIIAGSNEAAAAPANGLTIGITSIPSSMVSLVTGPDAFTFNFKKLEWLGAIGASPLVMVSCNPSITSWSQVVKSKAPLTMLAPPASANLIREELLSKMFGFRATVLTGYATSTAQEVGCVRGDGDLADLPLSFILNAAGTGIAPGIIPLISYGAVPKGSSYYRVYNAIPTLAAYLKKHPLKGADEATAAFHVFASQTVPQLSYFLPPGTPMPYVLALRTALAAAYKNPTIKQTLADVPDPNVLLSSTAITTLVSDVLKKYGPFMQKVYRSFGA